MQTATPTPTDPNADLDPAAYVDRKRYAWLLSLAMPFLVGFGPALMLWKNDVRLLWLAPALMYLLGPLLDYFLGEDESNPPESAVPALEADRYYRWITYLLVPILWAAFIFNAWFYMHSTLPWHGVLALALTGGMVGGFCINLGHELGHKHNRLERWLAKLVLAPSGYGHFLIEHNRGHHRDVATPHDPASSRMGENIYRFMLREMPGTVRRGWRLEAQRLRDAKLPLFSRDNEILQAALITLVLWASLIAYLGIAVLPFLLAVAFWSNFQLTSANYIEHYGLLRKQRADGRYEVCQPQHSWNSNHVYSNWLLFHLQRHADHHAHPLRRYQSLRHFAHLPRLPSGYFGMFLLAYVPPLWAHVMNPRLLQAVGNEVQRINFDPAKREQLLRQYGLQG